MERKPETDGQPKETRKPYHKPEVTFYGNIREITRNVLTALDTKTE